MVESTYPLLEQISVWLQGTVITVYEGVTVGDTVVVVDPS